MQRRDYAKYKPKRRSRWYFNHYGVDKAGIEVLAAKQGYKCAICAVALAGKYNVDHDHQTGRLRGILCGTCNLMLGYAHDRVEILDRAKRYLEDQVGV